MDIFDYRLAAVVVNLDVCALCRPLKHKPVITCDDRHPETDTGSIWMDDTSTEIAPAIKRALSHGIPCFMELVTPGEHKMIAPVAEWQRVAGEAAEQS